MGSSFDKVLVTGGAGFIGSHTVDALVMNGSRVWILDDLSTGRLRNLQRWKNNSAVHFVRGNIANRDLVDSLTRKVEAVVHLAALASLSISLRKPELTNAINVSGTLNLLQLALKNDVRRFVFASSSSVYGDSSCNRVKETAPLNPIIVYGASKLSAEKYCQAYHSSYSLETVSLRYFNVYGERQSASPYSGVIAIFSNSLLAGVRPTIYGDGKQTRDFVHVSDVARANLLALESRSGMGEAFNVGTGRATSINELYRLLAIATGTEKLRPVLRKRRIGDIINSCADTTKAHRSLGFRSAVDLSSGLEILVKSKRQ